MSVRNMRKGNRSLRKLVSQFFQRDKAKFTARNYDFPQHSFPAGQERSSRKSGSWLAWRRKPKTSGAGYGNEYRSHQHLTSKWLLRLIPLAVCALVLGIFLKFQGHTRFMALLQNISFFQVHMLVISGAETAGRDRIRDLAGIVENKTSLIGLNTAAAKAKIASDSWVSQVQVSKKWPSTVEIEIVEHKPVALINSGDVNSPKLYYVDNKGFSFLETHAGQDLDFPVITGLDRLADKQERDGVFTEIMVLLKKAAKNNPNLPAQSISEISVNPKGELIMYLVDYPFPIFFGKGRPTEKFNNLLRVLETLYRNHNGSVEMSQVAFIRLEYENDQVLVIKKSG